MSRAEADAGIYAERYRVESTLGRGGMGSVLQVFDLQTGQTLALKQLTLSDNTGDPSHRIALFQREFYILTQLNHPNVVRVFDYGVVEGVPYYTMELLHGRSLRELAPLPWTVVCGHLIELCFALSMLHLRGFAHRDLTPNNVLITGDRIAKLIDFGAMAPFGGVDAAVGTPPYMAPETLELSTVDSRADIFGLGALAYFMLTANHAFPAGSLAALPGQWRKGLSPISRLAKGVPHALEELIAAMLSVSPQARPAHLAEITQRLAQLLRRPTPAPPQLDAHLITPKLVGRESELKLAPAYATAAQQGNSSSVIITGEPGMGRTRLLEAFALEAVLNGLLTAHVRVSAAANEPLSLIKSLVFVLRQQAPERTVTAAAPVIVDLQPVWSEQRPITDVTLVSSALQQAIVRFFEQLQALCPIAICVDDIHLADSVSLQLILRLSRLPGQRVLLVCTAQPNNPYESAHLSKLRVAAEQLVVRPLTFEQTQLLLASIVGELAGLSALTHWVHQASEGRPQTCVELLQHLATRGVLRFYDGRFHLTGALDDLDLPHSIAELMLSHWKQLAEHTRLFAGVLSLSTHVFQPEVDLLVRLVAERCTEALAFDALTDLLSRRLIKVERERCSFAHPRFAAFVIEQLPAALRSDCARDLAYALEAQGEDFLGLTAHYLRLAGDLDRALAITARIDAQAIDATTPMVLFARSPLGQQLYEDMLAHGRARDEPPAELFRYRKVMLQLAAVDAPELTRYAPETLQQLRFDMGLDQWESFAHIPDSVARLVQCFELAEKRWHDAPERRRGLTPGIALKEFATCIALLVGAYVPIYETSGLDALPALIEPLRGLAPVLDIVYRLAKLSADSAVRGCFFTEERQEVIAMLRQPVAGMDAVTQNGAYLLAKFYLALELAARGSPAGDETARELEEAPLYAVLGKQLRLVIALGRGDAAAARMARQEREMLAMQSAFTDQHRETSVRWEATAAYRAADLLSVKDLVHAVQHRAARFPGARPFSYMLRAQYLLLTSQPQRALSVLRLGQALAAPLQHGCWRELSLLEMEALLMVNRPQEAGTCAERTEATLRQVGFDPRYEDRLTSTRALALAAAGELDRAKRLLDSSLQDFRQVAPEGVAYASLCETRARISLLEQDAAVFQEMAATIAGIYERGGHPGLIARYERLMSTARKALPPWALTSQHNQLHKKILDMVKTPSASPSAVKQEQFRQLLRVALDEAAAESGYLYAWHAERGLRQLAARGAAPLQPELTRKLERLLHVIVVEANDEEPTVTGSRAQGIYVHAAGQDYLPIVLRDYRDATQVIGLLAIATSRPIELGRGLLEMIAQTVSVLLAAPTPT